jgi:hypothetical protein
MKRAIATALSASMIGWGSPVFAEDPAAPSAMRIRENVKNAQAVQSLAQHYPEIFWGTSTFLAGAGGMLVTWAVVNHRILKVHGEDVMRQHLKEMVAWKLEIHPKEMRNVVWKPALGDGGEGQFLVTYTLGKDPQSFKFADPLASKMQEVLKRQELVARNVGRGIAILSFVSLIFYVVSCSVRIKGDVASVTPQDVRLQRIQQALSYDLTGAHPDDPRTIPTGFAILSNDPEVNFGLAVTAAWAKAAAAKLENGG